MPGIRTRPDELEPKCRALPMLAHGVGQLTTGAVAHRCRVRTADQLGLHRPAPERLLYRAGRGRIGPR